MSICNECYDAGAYVGACATGLTFGNVEVDTEYVVAVESISTGKIQSFTTTSDESGVITLEDVLLSQRTTYNVWVSIGSINGTPVLIDIDGTDYTCITFSVVDVIVEDGINNLTP